MWKIKCPNMWVVKILNIIIMLWCIVQTNTIIQTIIKYEFAELAKIERNSDGFIKN